MPRKGENIYKRKDGRWEGRYIKKRDIKQKAIYGYLYGKSYTGVNVNELIEFEILLYNRRQAVNTFSHIHVCRGNINLFETNSQHLFSPPKTNSEKFTSFP